jgi:4-hydroxyacetophenone monooxygenase
MELGGASVVAVPADTDDETIQRVVRRAAVVPLLAALAQTTGDPSLLRDDLRPDPAEMRNPDGGLTADQVAAGRELALETVLALRDAAQAGVTEVREDAGPVPTDAELRRLMDFLTGEHPSDDYLALLHEELGTSGADERAPDWRADQLAPGREVRVVVIGAGMSGLLAAHRLDQAGIDHVIIEKNPEVGGTWLENVYPGCRVDVPNHLYSYSFAQRRDWPQHFSTQSTLLGYFRSFAEQFALRDRIRFSTEVTSCTFDEQTGRWQVALATPDGGRETLVADAIVSAVGQLNRPKLPAIEGRDEFAGPSFHSARWDDSIKLDGQRVAVIGTGASAIQLIPEVADRAAELLVFQRTPNWFVPAPDYHANLSDDTLWLMDHVPNYSQWYRFWLFWRLSEGILPAAEVEPDWDGDPRSVGARSDELRQLLTMYLELTFGDDPDLLGKVVPQYPPLAKRMLLDNGIWPTTLKRDDVHLISDPIERITAEGVVTGDGRTHPVDVIIYATGFEASRFLMPMQVTGRGGVDLHERWADDPHAYLGITVPDFPNLFCLYGPNTNLVANGSIIFFSECEVRYALGCLRLLLETGHQSLDCRPEVLEAYGEWVDAANSQMAWGASDVNSWYKNAAGRVTQNWPSSLLEFWTRTRAPDPADYTLT